MRQSPEPESPQRYWHPKEIWISRYLGNILYLEMLFVVVSPLFLSSENNTLKDTLFSHLHVKYFNGKRTLI